MSSYNLKSLACVAWACLFATGFAQTKDPEQTLKSLNESQRTAISQAGATQESVQKTLAEQASKALEGVDVAKIQPQDAYAYAQIYRMAGRSEEAAKLYNVAINFNQMRAWEIQHLQLQDLLAKGDYDGILKTLDFATAGSIPMLGQFGEFVMYGLTPKLIDRNPQLLLDAWDLLLRRVDHKRNLTKEDRAWADFATSRMTVGRCKVLIAMGKEKEALAALQEIKTRYGKDPRCLAEVQDALNQLATTNHAAPDFKAQQALGSFTTLSALKGKVVILDFFAHWCGPCKRAFPEIRELYTELKGKGLEVVGVTSYYGYYGAEKNLSKAQEYAKMKDFIKEFNLTWPVAFTDGSASKAYGVSAIPHLVVIDRKGIVRYVQVGYGTAPVGKLKSTLEKLLAEK